MQATRKHASRHEARCPIDHGRELCARRACVCHLCAQQRAECVSAFALLPSLGVTLSLPLLLLLCAKGRAQPSVQSAAPL